MPRIADRLVFVALVCTLSGVIAGMVLSQTLIRSTAPAQATPAVVTCECAAPEPVVTQTVQCPSPNLGTPPMEVATDTVAPGEIISVTLGDGVLGTSAWVGLIPSDVPHGDDDVNDAHDVDYQWVTPRNVFQLTAPAQAGSYDVRLHNQYPDGLEVASVTITVVAQ